MKWFTNMRIAGKLILGFLVPTVLAVGNDHMASTAASNSARQ